MKAIVYETYGPPEVLRYAEIDAPVPKDDEVLVRLEASSINFADRAAMRGEPRLMRLAFGLTRPKATVLGRDIAGVVQAVGAKVTRFRPGDRVAGEVEQRGFAELVSAKESYLSSIPHGVPAKQAATTPVAGVTALRAVRLAGVQKGQKVLVNGSSGGVGTFLVQLARLAGAEVTAVCSTRNVDLVKADHVIDYTKADFTQGTKIYDVIVDLVGNHPLAAMRRVLAPQGIYIASFGNGGPVLGPIGKFLSISLISMFSRQKLRVLVAKRDTRDLDELLRHIADGAVIPVIDREYPLSAAADAIRMLEKEHARGKVILSVE